MKPLTQVLNKRLNAFYRARVGLLGSSPEPLLKFVNLHGLPWASWSEITLWNNEGALWGAIVKCAVNKEEFLQKKEGG